MNKLAMAGWFGAGVELVIGGVAIYKLVKKLYQAEEDITRMEEHMTQRDEDFYELEQKLQKTSDDLEGQKKMYADLLEQHNDIAKDLNEQITVRNSLIQELTHDEAYIAVSDFRARQREQYEADMREAGYELNPETGEFEYNAEFTEMKNQQEKLAEKEQEEEPEEELDEEEKLRRLLEPEKTNNIFEDQERFFKEKEEAGTLTDEERQALKDAQKHNEELRREGGVIESMRIDPNSVEAWDSFVDYMLSDVEDETLKFAEQGRSVFQMWGPEITERRRAVVLNSLRGTFDIPGEQIQADALSELDPDDARLAGPHEYDIQDMTETRLEFFGTRSRYADLEEYPLSVGEIIYFYIHKLADDLEIGSELAFLNTVFRDITDPSDMATLTELAQQIMEGRYDVMGLNNKPDALGNFVPNACNITLYAALDLEADFLGTRDEYDDDDWD